MLLLTSAAALASSVASSTPSLAAPPYLPDSVQNFYKIEKLAISMPMYSNV
jgi:hypothetical protein